MSDCSDTTCRNCRAFEPRIFEGKKVIDGYCRHYPPRPQAPDNIEGDHTPLWPIVEVDDWCLVGFRSKHLQSID
ncbi:MAG: hypothetical protein K6F50_04045 [Kiritimatiellae bacterium]|nr:hypothetical protein [Kiritimatiellia bacterium]